MQDISRRWHDYKSKSIHEKHFPNNFLIKSSIINHCAHICWVKDLSPLQRSEVHLTTNIPVTTILIPTKSLKLTFLKDHGPFHQLNFAWCNRIFQIKLMLQTLNYTLWNILFLPVICFLFSTIIFTDINNPFYNQANYSLGEFIMVER